MNRLNEDVRKFDTQDTIGAIIGYPFYLLLIFLYYLYYAGEIDLKFMYYIASWYIVFWYSIDLCSGLYFKRFLQVLAPIHYDSNRISYFGRVFFNIAVVAWSLFYVLYLY